MTKQVTDARLEELIRAKMPPGLHPLGHEGDCMSCDLVFALRELRARRGSTPDEPPKAPGDIRDQMASGVPLYGDPAILGYKR